MKSDNTTSRNRQKKSKRLVATRKVLKPSNDANKGMSEKRAQLIATQTGDDETQEPLQVNKPSFVFWLALKGVNEGKGRLIDCFKFTVSHFRELGNPVIKKWNRLRDLSLDLLRMYYLGKSSLQRECKPCDHTLQVVEGLDHKCCQPATNIEEAQSHFA